MGWGRDLERELCASVCHWSHSFSPQPSSPWGLPTQCPDLCHFPQRVTHGTSGLCPLLSSACASVCLSASARPSPSPCCGLIKCPSLAFPIPRVECVWVHVSVCLWLDLSARGSVFLYLTRPPPCSFIKYPSSFPSSFSCRSLGICTSVYVCVCT